VQRWQKPSFRVLVMGFVVAAGLPLSLADGRASQVVNRAKAAAKDIPGQAEALALLAWPDATPVDPEVASLARREIVGFGDWGLDALHRRLLEAPPRFGADITSAIIETRLHVTANLPAQYIPSLYDAVWYGSVEAKRLAMAELAGQRFPPAMLPIIDAVYEYPALTEVAVETLQRLGDDRARFFLGELLLEGDPAYRQMAAVALATIGGRCIDTLRDATVSERAQIRGAAIDALLPVSSVNDLTILYEYIAQFPEDDADRVDRVLQRATQLEAILEARQDVDAATLDDGR
jgi:hypothetical protein